VKAQDAAGNLSDASNAITITETAIPTYCDSKGDIVSDEYIAKVQLELSTTLQQEVMAIATLHLSQRTSQREQHNYNYANLDRNFL
jgi:hypothetical protein